MNALKNTGTQLGLLALLLAVGCTMVWFNQAEKVALPENRTLFIAVWLSAVALAIAAFVKKAGWLGRIAAVPARLTLMVGRVRRRSTLKKMLIVRRVRTSWMKKSSCQSVT